MGRREGAKPSEVAGALKCAAADTLPVSRPDDLSIVRALLDALELPNRRRIQVIDRLVHQTKPPQPKAATLMKSTAMVALSGRG
jgi:hypothetical protein